MMIRTQAKRSASEEVDPSGEDDFVRVDVEGGRATQDAPDHTTAQHGRQSRESCKRVRANDSISPEEHVAALSLNHDEEETASPSTQTTPEGPQQQIRLAKLLLQRGKQKQALQLLHAVITSDSANADALCLRGTCFSAEGNQAGVRIACSVSKRLARTVSSGAATQPHCFPCSTQVHTLLHAGFC